MDDNLPTDFDLIVVGTGEQIFDFVHIHPLKMIEENANDLSSPWCSHDDSYSFF